MKTAAVVVVLSGLIILCGCENAQLTRCQQENAELKAQAQKARTELTAANAKVDELKKKDAETQTKALDAVRTMLEKQHARDLEKDARINQLQAELDKMKVAAESK